MITATVCMPVDTKIKSFSYNKDIQFTLDTNGDKITCIIETNKSDCKNPILGATCCLCAPMLGVLTMLSVVPLLIYKKIHMLKTTNNIHLNHVYKLDANTHISSVSRSSIGQPLNITIEISNVDGQVVKRIQYT